MVRLYSSLTRERSQSVEAMLRDAIELGLSTWIHRER